jgi:hypothetical protein
MSKRLPAALFAALPAVLIAGTPAAALPVPGDYKAIGDTKTVALDPARSYLIVQTSSASSMYSFPIAFIRRPDKADIDDYLARRKAALDKAHAKWTGKHASWVKQAADWDKLPKQDRAGQPRPAEPVEPTDLNLAFPAIEQEGIVIIGPFNRFAKANGRSTFLHAVPPGRYAFYGPINIAAAAFGTCMCMGSIEFEVKPGQIVNGGMMTINFMAERAKAKAEGRPVPKTETDLPPDMNTISWEVPVAGYAVDPRLSAYTIVPAELHATGRIPNYYGLMIDRLTAIPGVLDYDRDRIIDVKAKPAG